jgi:hypothetical protein
MYHVDLEEFFDEKVITIYFANRAPGTWMKFHPPTIGDEINRLKLYKAVTFNSGSTELTTPWWLELAVLELSLLYLGTNIAHGPSLEEGASRENIEEFFRSLPVTVVEEIWNNISYSDWGKVEAISRLDDFNSGLPISKEDSED